MISEDATTPFEGIHSKHPEGHVTPHTHHAQLWQGAGWKVLSMACFALINGIVRHCSGGAGALDMDPLPVNVMVFFQNLFGTLCLFPWILNRHKTKSHNAVDRRGLGGAHFGLNLLRVFSAVLGICLWYFALKAMPVAESVALSFTGPVFTVVGAWLLLHEKMNTRRFIAIGLSLSGAFIIARPDIPLQSNVIGMAALLPLGSALALAFSKLLTRKLVLLGHTPTYLAASLLLLMTPISLLLALVNWQAPTLQHLPWLIGMGVLAACSHLTFAKAYQLADVAFLAPFGFSKFMLGALIGYCFFAELPRAWSLWLGLLVIFASILVLGYKMPLYSDAKRFRSS
jgi:drug/metabolite transporter (DMT)-like permease